MMCDQVWICIILFIDIGPQNITMGCWELKLNLSLPVQLFKPPIVIF